VFDGTKFKKEMRNSRRGEALPAFKKPPPKAAGKKSIGSRAKIFKEILGGRKIFARSSFCR